MPAALLALGIGILGYAVDQFTKMLAIDRLTPGEPQPLVGDILQLSLFRNPGAAFSMGTSLTFALSIFATVALLACLIFGLPRVQNMWQGAALGLLTAGIAGNLHDRLLREPSPLRGHVIDFLHLKYFAIFNVADMCITAAAVFVVVLTISDSRRERRNADV